MDFISARRMNDCVISICQDNEKKLLYILGANSKACEILGYSQEDLVSSSLDRILDPKTKDVVDESVDFLIYDLDAVLSKVRRFAILNTNNERIKVKMKIFPVFSSPDRLIFELLFREIGMLDKLDDCRYSLKDYIFPINDEQLGIYDNDSIMRELELLLNFAKEHPLVGVVSVFSFSVDLEEDVFIQSVGKLKNAIRRDDSIGSFGNRSAMVILPGCSEEYSENVIVRLKSVVGDIEGLAVGYMNIKEDFETKQVVAILSSQVRDFSMPRI